MLDHEDVKRKSYSWTDSAWKWTCVSTRRTEVSFSLYYRDCCGQLAASLMLSDRRRSNAKANNNAVLLIYTSWRSVGSVLLALVVEGGASSKFQTWPSKHYSWMIWIFKTLGIQPQWLDYMVVWDKPKIHTQGRLNKLISLFNEFDIVCLSHLWYNLACLFLVCLKKKSLTWWYTMQNSMVKTMKRHKAYIRYKLVLVAESVY